MCFIPCTFEIPRAARGTQKKRTSGGRAHGKLRPDGRMCQSKPISASEPHPRSQSARKQVFSNRTSPGRSKRSMKLTCAHVERAPECLSACVCKRAWLAPTFQNNSPFKRPGLHTRMLHKRRGQPVRHFFCFSAEALFELVWFACERLFSFCCRRDKHFKTRMSFRRGLVSQPFS